MTEKYSDVIGRESGLRRGLSSGSCAQAAAKAALEFLLSGETREFVEISLPQGNKSYSGRQVLVPIGRLESDGKTSSAFIRKDAGDDKDCTNGLLIGALVSLTNDGLVKIDGGEGVGRITKPGTAGKVGEAAINPVPRRMIKQEVTKLLPEGRGCTVVIFVPDGKKLAESTWNPRIGIEGGISIIGTKGVVEPKSEEAYKASINRVIQSYIKGGLTDFIITPGYVGEKYLSAEGILLNRVVTTGDHIGHAIGRCARRGAKRIVLVGHIGKLTKIAAGIFNTHWKSGDARLEVVAANAAACGASTDLVNEILSCSLAEDAVGLINKHGLQQSYVRICERVISRMNEFLKRPENLTKENENQNIETACVLLSLSGEKLASMPEDLSGWTVMKGDA